MTVIALDVPRIKSTLRNAAHQLRRDPNVLRVILFGSLVRGDYTGASDVDVLIVLKRDARTRWFDRIPEYQSYFSDVPAAVEVFPYTEEEIERAMTRGNLFFQHILSEGEEIKCS